MANLLGVDRQVLALALARMTESIGNSFLIVVLPLFIGSEAVSGATFGLTEVAITGIVLALFGLVNSSLQPITGRLSDRTGRRKIFVLVGLVLIASASFAYSLATTYWHLVVFRVLQGIAGALIIPTTVALVNDLATEDNRGGNMGTYNTFRLVGFGVGPIAAGGVVEAGPYTLGVAGSNFAFSGFDAAFYFATTTALLSFVLISVLIRDPDQPKTDAGDSPRGFAVFDRTGPHVLDPVFTLGLVSFFMAVGIALFATLGDIINARLDQGATLFGLQFAAFVLAQIFLQAPIGRATDFYGRKTFLVVGMILLVPTTLAQGLIFDPWVMFAARFAQGVAGAMVFAPALTLAGDIAPEGQSGSTLSVLTMAFGFGVAVGPLASGFLVAFGFVVPFAFGAVLAAVGAVLVWSQVEETITPKKTFIPAGWLDSK
ncbi:MAG: MFS transporter [Haloarculaceae archaeon]